MWDETKITQVLSLNHQTPFYCFDTDIFEERIHKVKERLNSSAKLCFSVKSNPWLAESASKYADMLEVCSMGELHLCMDSGIPLSKLSVGGVAKTKAECEELAGLNPHRISVESVNQLRLLNSAAEKYNNELHVLLRLTKGDQFGISKERISQILEDKEQYKNICFEGIHYYFGTQKKDPHIAEKELNFLSQTAAELSVKEIEFGSGAGVPLFADQSEDDLEKYMQDIYKRVDFFAGFDQTVLECGRALTYDSGIYAVSVVDKKAHYGKEYLIVDGGIHQLSYYGQIGGKPLPNIIKRPISKGETKKYIVCGSLCTASDILANGVELSEVKIGDRLVFLNTGAYSVTEARSLFLSRELPAVYLSGGGKNECVRRQTPTYPLNSSNRKDLQ